MKTVLFMLIFSQTSIAQMPSHIIGTWVIDVKATQQKMRESGEFEEQGIKYMAKLLPTYKRIITKNQMEIINGKRKMHASLSLAKSKQSHTVADVTADGETSPKFQIEFVPYKLKNIIMKLSISKQMDDFIWVKQ